MLCVETSCQTTSGAPIGDLIVSFCTHFIFRKSHERTAPNPDPKFFNDSKTELGAFFTPSAIRGLIVRLHIKYLFSRLLTGSNDFQALLTCFLL